MGTSPKLLSRWQQAQLMTQVGIVDMARDAEVRALHAANKRLAQELGTPTLIMLSGGPQPEVAE